jgi:hypothetical protein
MDVYKNAAVTYRKELHELLKDKGLTQNSVPLAINQHKNG